MSEPQLKQSKPGVEELLIATALDPELRARLIQSPESVFVDYDLTVDEQEMLRNPDHRLLSVFGSVLARQPRSTSRTSDIAGAQSTPHAVLHQRMLGDLALGLTVVPCRVEQNEQQGYAYAVWVNPLGEGIDPASVPPPVGATLPGEPVSPLYAVIRLSAVELRNDIGNAQVGLWASFRQSTNVTAPPAPESAGRPEATVFGEELDSIVVRMAADAVRRASQEDRYGRLLELVRAVQGRSTV